MANTYVIASQIFLPPGTPGPTPSNPDPQIQITGTVNGVPVTVVTWHSIVNLASAVGYINAVTPLMLAAYNAAIAPVPKNPPVLTWTI
jgi:hypothetical protein